MTRTKPFLLLLVVLALVAMPAAALADAAYHTDHIELQPVDNEPLRSGAVTNIHANGPEVYAKEVYVLNGATPDTEFFVRLHVFTDAACTTNALPFPFIPTDSFMTNRAGNGHGSATFTPVDIAGLAPDGGTFWLIWEVTDGDSTSYETDCSTVILDDPAP